jgi:flavin-dependent dehydrogenase
LAESISPELEPTMTGRGGSLDDAANGSPWDAIVIGAGPAGSLAVRELAIAGARALLVERTAFPRDKVCGACLNDQALEALRSSGLGRLPQDLGGIPLGSFRVGHARRSVQLPLPAGIAVSRARLDSALAGAAVDAGAWFLTETRATVGHADGPLRSVTLSRRGQVATVDARVVLVASGLGTGCLPADGPFQTRTSKRSRVGAGCRVETFPDFYGPGTIFMAVGRAGYVGLVRVEDGSLNVAAAFDKPFLTRCGSPSEAASAVLAEAGFPAIRDIAEIAWKGTMALTRRTRPLAENRVFLIGDACGYVEPFTGEGMGWALLSARAVAPLALRGIERWEPSLERGWGAIHRRRIGRRQRLCRGLASLLRHPWLIRGTFELASRAPSAARLVIDRVNTPPHLSPIRPNLS